MQGGTTPDTYDRNIARTPASRRSPVQPRMDPREQLTFDDDRWRKACVRGEGCRVPAAEQRLRLERGYLPPGRPTRVSVCSLPHPRAQEQ
jgi:hypothetical protein